MVPKFVLAWITSNFEESQTFQTGGHVVFVRHPERGWEIPGGHLNPGESPEQALIREVLEETGLDVEIITWNKEYYENGWVAHAVTNSKPNSDSWNVTDEKVDEIAWWNCVPPVIMWAEQEFIDLDNWHNSVK
jgi:8-oxo-dGTP diphosphatase